MLLALAFMCSPSSAADKGAEIAALLQARSDYLARIAEIDAQLGELGVTLTPPASVIPRLGGRTWRLLAVSTWPDSVELEAGFTAIVPDLSRCLNTQAPDLQTWQNITIELTYGAGRLTNSFTYVTDTGDEFLNMGGLKCVNDRLAAVHYPTHIGSAVITLW